MSNEPVAALRDVTFAYDVAPVLDGVTLTIHAGELLGVVGPNGGGKTTLLKLILGLLAPARGRVEVFGRAPRHARHRMGYVPQHAMYDPRFPVTALDVVLMGRLALHWGGWYSRQDKAAALEALDEVGLADMRGRPFRALSGGERQRVLIARALVSDPELLLLDEPTANIDAAVGERLLDILESLNQRMTIVMVSHDLGFVSNIVGSVACVNRKVVIHPTTDLTGEAIQDLYEGEYRLIRHDHRCAEEGHSHV